MSTMTIPLTLFRSFLLPFRLHYDSMKKCKCYRFDPVDCCFHNPASGPVVFLLLPLSAIIHHLLFLSSRHDFFLLRFSHTTLCLLQLRFFVTVLSLRCHRSFSSASPDSPMFLFFSPSFLPSSMPSFPPSTCHSFIPWPSFLLPPANLGLLYYFHSIHLFYCPPLYHTVQLITINKSKNIITTVIQAI